MIVAKRLSKTERLARALWNFERFDLADGGTMPAFTSYADGREEGCPWEDQKEDLHEYFHRLSRRLIRAMNR